jgi:TRAP-type mannitol/chloroaromatic compound transport system substrate-binding protein
VKGKKYFGAVVVAIMVVILIMGAAACAAKPPAGEVVPKEQLTKLQADLAKEKEKTTVAEKKAKDLEAEVVALKTPAKVIEVKFGMAWGGGYAESMCTNLEKYMNEAFDGRFKFVYFPGDSVAPVAGHLNATSDGVFDLYFGYEGYYTEEQPVFDLFSKPIVLRGPEDIWKLWKLGGMTELADKVYGKINIHYIARRGKSSDAMVSTKPCPQVENLKGIKFRSKGTMAEALTLLGASAIFTDPGEDYTNLSSGLIDACDPDTYYNNMMSGIHEVAKYTVYPPLTSVLTVVLLANQDFWNTLSPAEQSVMEKVWWYIGDCENHLCQYEEKATFKKLTTEMGVTINYWNDASQKKWSDALAQTMKTVPDDPDWAEGWQLIQDYMEYVGYK